PDVIALCPASLPQSVDPSLPAGRQLAVMCAVSVALAAVTDSSWAIAAGLGRAWVMPSWWGGGHSTEVAAGVVHAVVAGEAARPVVRRGSDRRRSVAVAGAAAKLTPLRA